MAAPQVQIQEVQRTEAGQRVERVTTAHFALNVGVMDGGTIHLVERGQRVQDRIRPRAQPPRILPRVTPGFLDRGQELGQVGEALARGQVVDLHGPDGVGKTALISQAMRTQLAQYFPAGQVYLQGKYETPDDALQQLLEAFFETNGNVKVAADDVRRYMAGKRALIAVDDVNHLGDREAEGLADAVPQCSVLIAGRNQQVWQGASVTLRGLPPDQAFQLFEQNWGAVSPQDRPTAEAICAALDHVPLSIIKTARTAAQHRLPLAQVLDQAKPPAEKREPVGQAFGLVAGQLSERERRLLGALAAAGGPTVSLEALAVIAGMSPEEINGLLPNLQQAGLVHTNSPRLSLDDGFRPYVRGAWASEAMQARAAEYYLRLAPELRGPSVAPDERNVMAALGYYYRRGEWQQVIYIARGVERYLATTGRWGQWHKRLNQAWQAAKELGDQAAQAWAQNQLGLIAAGLGHGAEAAALFKGALSIWQALGNQTGMTITRWNLQILAIAPPPVKGKPGGKAGAGGGSSLLPVLLAAVAAVILLLGTVLVFGGRGDHPPATEGPPPTTAVVPTTAVPTTAVPTIVVPPELDLELAAGCDETYAYPGGTLTILLQSSVDGTVEVFWVDPQGARSFLFRQDVQAGRTATRNWDVPGTGGNWRLEADLNSGEARDVCRFAVDTGPEPQVQVWLEEGCERTYQPGETFTIQAHANVDGTIAVTWAGRDGRQAILFEERVQGAEIVSREWTAPDTAGRWVLQAELEGTPAHDECAFSVEIPEVQIELGEGCDRAYAACQVPEVRLEANVAGEVDVYLVDPEGQRTLQFSEQLLAERAVTRSWEVPRQAGNWALQAVLNDGQATGTCSFSVDPESAQPIIHEIRSEPFVPDVGATPEPIPSVCPGDKVWVYVRTTDACGGTPERVEIRARYPAGSGDWSPAQMFPVDAETFRHPLTAHEEPGTEFYIYVEDAYGNWTRSPDQSYSVEPCITVLYDFVEMADQAEWQSYESYYSFDLTFPGSVTDSLGFALWQDSATLEDGSRPARVLETHPYWQADSRILGIYDLRHITLQAGDRFVARVGFLQGAGAGDVTFRVLFEGTEATLGTLRDSYDGQIRDWVIPIPSDAIGHQGRFYLIVEAGESSAQDWAVWVEARLERP